MTPSALWKAWTRTVASSPKRLALGALSTGETWTRKDLDALARNLADGPLRDAGGRRVALCGVNSAAWVASFLALQLRGASAVLFDASTPLEKREEAARQAGADWLVDLATEKITVLRSRRPTAARDEVCVKLTSGTSGVPKRIPCTAGNLLSDGRHILKTMKIGEKDRNLALIPFGHSYGLGNLILPLILSGAALFFAPLFVPSQIPAWIRGQKITIFPAVPPLFRIVAGLPGRDRIAPLRMAISAGAPLPLQTARDFEARFGVRIHNFYGSSETGGICFDRTGACSLNGASLGTPLSGVRVDILRNGRIRVSSGAVAKPSGTFLLPDLGEKDASGKLRLLGRVGVTANVGGKKVGLGEIEAALRALSGVRDLFVTVIPHPRGDSDLIAAAVETDLAESELRRSLAKALADWKMPRLLLALPLLPRTERGKIDAAALRARLGV